MRRGTTRIRRLLESEDFGSAVPVEPGWRRLDESLTERLQLMAVPFSLRLAYVAAFGNFVSFTHDTWRRLTAAIRGSPRKGFPALKKASRK